MNRLERKVLLGVLLGVAVYAGLAVWADVEAVQREVLGFAWRWFAVALGLSLGNYFFRFLKWQYYLGRLHIRVPLRQSALVFLASFLLTITPGKVGEVLKSYLLKRSRGIAISVTAPIVVAERLTDLIGLMCLALVGVSTYAYGAQALLVSGSLVLGIVLFVSSPRAADGAIRLVARVPLLGRLAPKLRVAYGSMRAMVRPRPLIVATVLSVVAWSLECLAFFFVIGGFVGGRPELVAAVFLYAFTTILGAISFIPGGLGVTEGSMSVGLVELGLFSAESQAVAATYLIRLATLWFAVGLGLLAFVVYRRRYLDGALETGLEDGPEPPAAEEAGEGQSSREGA